MSEKRRKVNILCNTLTGGGIQKVMQDVANYLAAKPDQYEVTVTVLESPVRSTELLDSHIKIRGVFRSQASYKRYTPAWIWHILCRNLYCLKLSLQKQDVLLVLKDGWYFKLGGYLRANKKIAWFHTASSEEGQEHWTRIFFRTDEEERKCAETYDHIICVTEYGKQQVINQIGELNNLVVRYNPIDVDSIISKSESGTKKPAVPYRPLFVMANRLSPIKGTMIVLQCLERLQAEHECSLWIVGDGEQREELKTYVHEHSIRNVSFLGWQKNPYPYLAAADWFISASKYETFGLTVHEAAALNIPSIVATLPVFEECASKELMLLVENSLDGIYNGMKQVLEQPEKFLGSKQTGGHSSQETMYTKRLKSIENLIQDSEQ